MSTVLAIEAQGLSHFRQYGKSFQEKIFQGLTTDKLWAQQMAEVMEPSFFELRYLQYLSQSPLMALWLSNFWLCIIF